MSRQQYRNKLGMIFDILKSISENNQVKISTITRYSNMSHYAALVKLTPLINGGYVKKEIIKTRDLIGRGFDTFIYSMTPKGLEFYKQLENFDKQFEEHGGIFTN